VWVAGLARFGFAIAAPAILLAAFVQAKWVSPIVAFAFLCAVIQTAAASVHAVSKGSVRLLRWRFDRDREPVRFWGLIGLNALLIAIFAAVALYVFGIRP
jgi:hypothetical protein